jgi:hypothetical protein
MSNPIHIVLLLGLVFGFVLPAVLVAHLADRRRSQLRYLSIGVSQVSWVVPLIGVLILPAAHKVSDS